MLEQGGHLAVVPNWMIVVLSAFEFFEVVVEEVRYLKTPLQ